MGNRCRRQIKPTAVVKIKQKDELFVESAVGDGPIDALYSAIRKIVSIPVEIIEYKINSLSRGNDALGKVSLRLNYQDKLYYVKAIDTDIIKASALALLNGINKIRLEEYLNKHKEG